MTVDRVIFAIAAWCALIAIIRLWLVPRLARGPGGDAVNGVIWLVVRAYARVLHLARYEGLEELRNQLHVGPLIVVSNHTGAVDPLLIQAGCRFHIRWMMASEMMTPALDWLWKKQRMIPVERDARDLSPAREAMRHLEAGEVIGIFPEGRIVVPPRAIRPFYTGIGLIAARSQAPVLLVWVSGTPEAANLLDSLITPSRARVVYIGILDFKGERDGHVITQKLRDRLAEVSGWPRNDEKLPPSDRAAREF